MASPVELGQALAAIGLFARAPGEADLAGGRKRLGSTELLRLETTHWLAGAAAMQVLVAESAAIDAGVEPVRITRAAERLLSGAGCEGEDLAKVAFAQFLAKQLEALLMVLVAEAVKGRADMPLVIQPAMLVAGHLAALLQAGTEASGGTPAGSTADRGAMEATECDVISVLTTPSAQPDLGTRPASASSATPRSLAGKRTPCRP